MMRRVSLWFFPQRGAGSWKSPGKTKPKTTSEFYGCKP